MTIQLTRATYVSGVLEAAASQHTLDAATEAAFVSNGSATWVGDAPSAGGAVNPAFLTTGPNGEVSLQALGVEFAANGLFDVRSPVFGAKCDGQALYAVTTTNSATCTIADASASFTSSDIGKICAVISATASAANAKYGTITAVAADGLSCTATLNSSPGVLSGAMFVYGTDDTTAINAALTAATSAVFAGHGVFLPDGITCASAAIVVPDGVSFVGAGNTKTVDFARKFRYGGSSLVLLDYMPSGNFLTVGDASSTNSIGSTLQNMNVDSFNLAGKTIGINCRGAHLLSVTGIRGTTYTAALGASGVTEGCTFIQQQSGHTVNMGGDSRFVNNYVYGAGANKHNVRLSGVSDVFIGYNHIWKDSDTPTAYGSAVYIEFYTGTKFGTITVEGNQFDTSFGPHVQITATGTNVNGRGVAIIGNHGFQNDSVPNATYPFIGIAADATCQIRALTITGNTGCGSWNDPTKGQYTYFVDGSAVAGNVYGSIATGNAIDNCAALYNFSATWTAWDHDGGNIVIAGTGTTVTASTIA